MKQVIIAGRGNNFSVTTYNSVGGGRDWNANIDYAKQVVSSPGSFSNLEVEVAAAPGVGNSYIFTLMKNGVATALVTTISGGAATTGVSAGSVAVVAGDNIELRATYAGAPADSNAHWSIKFEGTVVKESLILGIGLCVIAATAYSPLAYGLRGAGDAAEAPVYQVIPTGGNIKNLYVALDLSPGANPDGYRFTLRKGGVGSTPLTVTITAPATSGNNVADSVAVVAGDTVDLMIEPLNGPANAPTVWWGFTFEATIDGESLILGQSSASPATAATNYNHVTTSLYSFPWQAAESATIWQGGQPSTLKKLYVQLSVAPGGAASYLIGVRHNASTKLSVTLVGGATTGSDLVNTWDALDYSELNIISTPAGGPAATVAHWGVVGYIQPPPSGPKSNILSKVLAAIG